MKNLQVIKTDNQRVLTTRELSEMYGVETIKIQQNFTNNKSRYIEGKHYYILKGEELKKLKNDCLENFESVGKRAKSLYLWTEKGALLHAKSLNTDKAWEAYEYLIDFYFRAIEDTIKEEIPKEEQLKISTNAGALPHIFHHNRLVMPLQDFHTLTGVDPRKHKYFFREEIFKGGHDYNGWGNSEEKDLAKFWEEKYNFIWKKGERDWERNSNTITFMYREGVQKGLYVINASDEVRKAVNEYFEIGRIRLKEMGIEEPRYTGKNQKNKSVEIPVKECACITKVKVTIEVA